MSSLTVTVSTQRTMKSSIRHAPFAERRKNNSISPTRNEYRKIRKRHRQAIKILRHHFMNQ